MLNCIVMRRNEKGKSVMKKRVVTILVAIAITISSVAPATPVYAQENLISGEAMALESLNEDEAEDVSGEASSEVSSEAASDSSRGSIRSSCGGSCRPRSGCIFCA